MFTVGDVVYCSSYFLPIEKCTKVCTVVIEKVCLITKEYYLTEGGYPERGATVGFDCVSSDPVRAEQIGVVFCKLDLHDKYKESIIAQEKEAAVKADLKRLNSDILTLLSTLSKLEGVGVRC